MTDVKSLYSSNKPTGGNGLFLKIDPDKSAKLRILGLPIAFDSEYEGKVSKKWAWPVYNHDEEKVQILQGGAQIYTGLLALIEDDDWGDPAEYDITVKRSGSGTDTKYAVNGARTSKEVPADLEIPDVQAVIGASPSASNVRKLGEEAPQKDVVLDDISDEPIDLSEIPF